MADAQLIVTAKRLSSDLKDLRKALRSSYPDPRRQVVSAEIRKRLSVMAEAWLTDISKRHELGSCVSSAYLADLSVHFQRLLLCAERATVRRRYDEEIKAILKDFTPKLVIPLMQGPSGAGAEAARSAAGELLEGGGLPEPFMASAFVGHSFLADDLAIASVFIRVLEAVGITVATGERPQAEKISEKVKRRIERQHIFVGVFTRRDKLAGKDAWNTSAWVIDEKAYAFGKNKKLILLKEDGVDSIGGIQGDYEYIEFSRDHLQDAVLRVLQLFSCSVEGMRD